MHTNFNKKGKQENVLDKKTKFLLQWEISNRKKKSLTITDSFIPMLKIGSVAWHSLQEMMMLNFHITSSREYNIQKKKSQKFTKKIKSNLWLTAT